MKSSLSNTYLFGLMLILILMGCCKNEKKSDEEIFHLYFNTDKPVYVIVCRHDVCFPCAPVYYKLFRKLREENIPKERVIFVLTYLREIEKESFIKNRLKLKEDEFLCFFSDELHTFLQESYNMENEDFFIAKIKDDVYISELRRDIDIAKVINTIVDE